MKDAVHTARATCVSMDERRAIKALLRP